jgi:hypothetical protein
VVVAAVSARLGAKCGNAVRHALVSHSLLNFIGESGWV